jgi:hypothetical protein
MASELAQVASELNAYAFRLKMLRLDYFGGTRRSLTSAAIAYREHLRSLRTRSPPTLHEGFDALLDEYTNFVDLCVTYHPALDSGDRSR